MIKASEATFKAASYSITALQCIELSSLSRLHEVKGPCVHCAYKNANDSKEKIAISAS